jgi:hypothetical protein
LRALAITHCAKVTDASLSTLVTAAGAGLRELHLGWLSGVTDATLEAAAKHCPSLETVRVDGCKSVGDAGPRALALECKNLRRLVIIASGFGE